jgi:hypothetical protein
MRIFVPQNLPLRVAEDRNVIRDIRDAKGLRVFRIDGDVDLSHLPEARK